MANTAISERYVSRATRPAKAGEISFPGFRAPTSNTTFTPNQFFDFVIPNFSRGVVRIVAYLLRKTLGWCDRDGNPQEEQIEVTYSELELKAGVSRDMIRAALDDALSGHLIECVAEARAKHAHDPGQSARYQLCWSSASYTTDRQHFLGFFEGEGNRTDIPNEFFDIVIPREPLSIIKVVGSVIRNSIGFQAKHGRRRQQASLSYQQIENYGRFGSRSDVAKALQVAIKKNYIVRIHTGIFSHSVAERRRAVYAVRWCDYPIGQKIEPAPDRSDFRTSISQISEPEDRSENRTSIKTKPENETLNNQAVDSKSLKQKLIALGFNEETASKLMHEHDESIILQQIAWLPDRAVARSEAGLLRRSIEQGWSAPVKLRPPEVLGTRGWEFARSFYAAYGGNRGEPVNEPSPTEVRAGEAFVERLSRATMEAGFEKQWGRELGTLAREQRNPFPSLTLAIRQLGDAFLVQREKQRLTTQLSSITQRRELHEQQFRELWLRWLADQEADMRSSQPEELGRFTAQRESDRIHLTADPKPWSQRVLKNFDTDSARLGAFCQFFGLPNFWQWDAQFNSQSFQP